ncbi:hypothetical protein MaudMau93_000835 [Microsporum audouinii]
MSPKNGFTFATSLIVVSRIMLLESQFPETAALRRAIHLLLQTAIVVPIGDVITWITPFLTTKEDS